MTPLRKPMTPLRKDLKPGTVFQYLTGDLRGRTLVVPPRHPKSPYTNIMQSRAESPISLNRECKIIWEPPEPAPVYNDLGEVTP